MDQVDNFNRSVYKDLAEYYDDSPIESNFKDALLQTMNTGNTVLDVGCGSGRYSSVVLNAGNTVYGLDIVDEALSIAKKRGVLTSKQDLCAHWSYENDFFNRMMCIEVLEHLLEPKETLKEMNRCLVKGGKLFLSVPNTAWWKHRVSLLLGKTSFCDGDGFSPADNPHIRHYTYTSMQSLLEKHGFQVEQKIATYSGFPGMTRLARAGVMVNLLSAGAVFVATKK